MSFASREISDQNGQPIMLFEFERDGVFWRYAAYDESITVGGAVYAATVMANEGITQSGDTTQDEFKITAPLDLPIVTAHLVLPPATTLNVRVRRVHYGDSDAPVVWVGTLNRVKAISDAAAEIYCRNALATLPSGGLRLAWTRNCAHMLFDTQCGLARNDFKRTGEVTEVTTAHIIVPALIGLTPSGVLLGGYAEWTTTQGYKDRRTISFESGELVQLLGGTFGIEVGMTVDLFFGCDHTLGYCNTVFDNIANYGGFPHLPERSPFDGNQVF